MSTIKMTADNNLLEILKQSDIDIEEFVMLAESHLVIFKDITGKRLTVKSMRELDYPDFIQVQKRTQKPIIVLYNLKELLVGKSAFPILEQSILNALAHGFVKYSTREAEEFSPAFKHPVTDLLWIHSMDHLLRKLGLSSPKELIGKGYDIESYYYYNLQPHEVGSLAHITWIAMDGFVLHCMQRFEFQNFPNRFEVKKYANKIVTDIYGEHHILYEEIKWATYAEFLRH